MTDRLRVRTSSGGRPQSLAGMGHWGAAGVPGGVVLARRLSEELGQEFRVSLTSAESGRTRRTLVSWLCVLRL